MSCSPSLRDTPQASEMGGEGVWFSPGPPPPCWLTLSVQLCFPPGLLSGTPFYTLPFPLLHAPGCPLGSHPDWPMVPQLGIPPPGLPSGPTEPSLVKALLGMGAEPRGLDYPLLHSCFLASCPAHSGPVFAGLLPCCWNEDSVVGEQCFCHGGGGVAFQLPLASP